MGIEVSHYLGCNQDCKYCYAKGLRQKTKPWTYNLDAVIQTIRELHKQYPLAGITLHGGEALCMPIEDLEKVLSESYQLRGNSAIQTNGSLIDDNVIRLFKKYKTSVGISIDGSDELNEFRTAKETTRKVINTIKKMVEKDISVGVITVVHKANAGTNKRLEKLKQFVHNMELLGINGRLSPLNITAGTKDINRYKLPIERLMYVYKELAKFMLENGYKWSPFRDIWNVLQGKNSIVCTFGPCDLYHTRSITVIMSDGMITNCLRFIPFLRSPIELLKREETLSKVPMEYGGCKECRFFPFCNGGCSTSGLNKDWRNRDANCPAYKTVFEFAEKSLNAQGINIRYPKQDPEIQTMVGGHSDEIKHTDGIEHTDGDIRHLDSSIGKREHLDGIEHTDGDFQHLDGMV